MATTWTMSSKEAHLVADVYHRRFSCCRFFLLSALRVFAFRFQLLRIPLPIPLSILPTSRLAMCNIRVVAVIKEP